MTVPFVVTTVNVPFVATPLKLVVPLPCLDSCAALDTARRGRDACCADPRSASNNSALCCDGLEAYRDSFVAAYRQESACVWLGGK